MRRAFTLLEVVAVTAILAAVAAAVLAGMPRLLTRHALDAAAAELRREAVLLRADALGRGTVLRLDGEGWRATDAERPGALLRLPAGCRAAWSGSDGRELASLAIDRRGRSADCVVTLDAEGQRRRLRWLGLSGQWQEVPP